MKEINPVNNGAPKEEQKKNLAEGVVVECLPNTMFKVSLDGGKTLIVYLGGKMRLHRIRVLIGDRVSVELDAYGEKGRIVRRF